MAAKWIIIEDRFIMGEVDSHEDLMDEDIVYVHGGGLSTIDAVLKKVTLYGIAPTLGACSKIDFDNVWYWLGIPPEVTGYDLYFVSPESIEYFIKKI